MVATVTLACDWTWFGQRRRNNGHSSSKKRGEGVGEEG